MCRGLLVLCVCCVSFTPTVATAGTPVGRDELVRRLREAEPVLRQKFGTDVDMETSVFKVRADGGRGAGKMLRFITRGDNYYHRLVTYDSAGKVIRDAVDLNRVDGYFKVSSVEGAPFKLIQSLHPDLARERFEQSGFFDLPYRDWYINGTLLSALERPGVTCRATRDGDTFTVVLNAPAGTVVRSEARRPTFTLDAADLRIRQISFPSDDGKRDVVRVPVYENDKYVAIKDETGHVTREYTHRSVADLPRDIFSLTQFGIPEPAGVARPFFTLPVVLGLVAAALAVLAGFIAVVRWRRAASA